MKDREYITLEVKIEKTNYGSRKFEGLKGIHLKSGTHELSDDFKEMLWNDYSIDYDGLIENFGDTKDISTLLIDA